MPDTSGGTARRREVRRRVANRAVLHRQEDEADRRSPAAPLLACVALRIAVRPAAAAPSLRRSA